MDLEKVKGVLLSKKDEIEARLERTHQHIYHRQEPVSANFSEQIKQTENDELVQLLEEEGKYEIQQIQNALERLESGIYLHCSNCGDEIVEARLNSVPFTDKCIKCAE